MYAQLCNNTTAINYADDILARGPNSNNPHQMRQCHYNFVDEQVQWKKWKAIKGIFAKLVERILHRIADLSRSYKIKIKVEHITSRENPADKLTRTCACLLKTRPRASKRRPKSIVSFILGRAPIMLCIVGTLCSCFSSFRIGLGFL